MITNMYFFYEACVQDQCVYLLSLLLILIVTAGFLMVLFIRELILSFRHRLTDCSLQVRIDKDLQSSQKRRMIQQLKYWIDQLYLPSKFTFAFLIFITVIVFTISHLEISNNLLQNVPLFRVLLNDNDYQNFIAITAGIGTVIFALIIFVAETLRDDSERARVLLKESWLFPLTFFGVTTLLMFLWLDVTYVSTLVIFALGGFAIFSISQMIRLLLNRSLFLEKEQNLFKDRVKKSIDKALRLRVGNNIFLKRLEDDDYNIDFSIFSEEKEGFTSLSLVEFGIITDINLCALNLLLEKLEEIAGKSNLSFKIRKDARPIDEESLEVNDSFSETETKKRSPIKGYLLKKLGDELDGNRQQALIIPKKIIDSEKYENEIAKLIQDVYVLNNKPEESLSEQLRKELSRKKDIAVEALRSGKSGVLEEVADLYISVVESFLEIIKEVGGGYSQKEARKERGAIIGGWDEVRWVSKDLRWLLEEVVQTENREVISILTHVPIAISIRAINFSDHFVFQEFVQFQTLLYRLSHITKNKNIKDYLVDRSWRYLKEMADFYVAGELQKSRPPIELENFRDFGIDIMQVFQALLKESFSNRDVHSFELFISATSKLFDHFKPSEDHPSVKDLKFFLKRKNIDESEKRELEGKLSQQFILEKLESELNDRKQELFFGISGWILSKYMDKDFDDPVLKQFWEISTRYLSADIADLIDVYQRARGFDTEDFWGWDWWEIEERPEGVASSIDVSGKFDWVFTVRILSLIKSLTKNQILEIKIESKRDLVYLLDKEESALKKRLNLIFADREKWEKVLPSEAFDKIDILKQLFDRVVQQQEENEAEILANSALNDSKVEDFYKEFFSAFLRSAGLRNFFNSKNEYRELKRQTKKAVKQWGFNQIADKAAFLTEWYVSYPDWGKHYGGELASAEDRRIYDEIKEILPKFTPDSDNLNTKIGLAIDQLKSKGYKPSIIMTTIFPGEFYRENEGEGEFIPQYRLDDQLILKKVSGFIGMFRFKNEDIPVIETRARGKDQVEEVCVVDIKNFATLVQHPPYMEASEKQYKRDMFVFRVVDLNTDDELRQKIIDQNPQWLSEHSEPEKYLRQRVVINILERLEVRIKNKGAGLRFIISEM